MDRTETGTLAAELLALERRRQHAPLEGDDARRHQELFGTLLRRLSPSPHAERREFLRIPADLEAKFRLGQATITCPAGEISMGGLSLRGHLWVIEEQELLLENLRVGKRDYPMAIRARVVWKVSDEDARPRAGLQFIELDANGRRQVKAVYEQLFIELLARLADA
jgi:hypothetical protein